MKKWEEKAIAEFKKDAAKSAANQRAATRDAANRRLARIRRLRAAARAAKLTN